MNNSAHIQNRDITIDLIRHGEPVGGKKYRGHQIDDPLSDKGWQQMWHSVGEHAPWQRIVTSPLRRCREFAEILSERQQIPHHIEPQLKEVGFGLWEGRSSEQIRNENPEDYLAFHTDPVNNRPHGSEPLETFLTRVTSAYTDILANASSHDLVVAHAGVIRAIVAHVLEMKPAAMYRIKIENAGITRIQYNGLVGKIVFINGRLEG